jgi:hypothetical protein
MFVVLMCLPDGVSHETHIKRDKTIAYERNKEYSG